MVFERWEKLHQEGMREKKLMKQVAFELFELDIVGLIDFDLWRWEERNSWQKEYYEQIKKKHS